jgi:hypothetical protein
MGRMKPKQNQLNNQQSAALWRSINLGLLLLLAATFGFGCKPESKAVAGPNLVGAYNLVSVNGNNVPCTIQHEGQSPTIKSGIFTINADGTCSSKVAFSLPSGGDTSREVKATYTREGSKLTMKWEGAGTTTGTVQGNTFTMDNEGMALVFRK